MLVRQRAFRRGSDSHHAAESRGTGTPFRSRYRRERSFVCDAIHWWSQPQRERFNSSKIVLLRDRHHGSTTCSQSILSTMPVDAKLVADWIALQFASENSPERERLFWAFDVSLELVY